MSSKYNIQIDQTEHSRLAETDFDNLVFGKVLSDHMFKVEYDNGAWGEPEISPFRNLHVNPAISSLHYGQSVFEGLKAYKNAEGKLLVFRPDEHSKRLNRSADRICMPQLPEDLFLEGLYKLLKLDIDWVPEGEGTSLYIRPFMFATEMALGVRPSQSYAFIIFTSPVAQYYSGEVKVIVEEDFVRAADGGTGFVKTGGNYAGSLLPAKKAIEKGYDQVLWTDGKEHKYIEEIGTMNVMFQIGDTIITPNISSSILPGITRKSVVELARHWGQPIEERKISVEEVIAAHKAGDLKDAFGTGTAATITHISDIGAYGENYKIGNRTEDLFSVKARNYLSDLKVGKAEDYMNWMVHI